MSRNICVTAAEGNTGFVITELLLSDPNFKSKTTSVTGLALNPDHDHCKDLAELGAKIVPHRFGRVRDTAKILQDIKVDTLCLVPPAHRDKVDMTIELIEAAKRANVPNVLFLSAAGCDMAERMAQPRLREFIDLEALFMKTKGDPNTATGHSGVIIRAGFYAENLLLYAPQAQEEGLIPIPIGPNHKFPPVALGDVAQLAAHVLTGKGKNGFSEKHRGQLMVVTGPTLLSGDELAKAASQVLGVEMKYDDISENEARRALRDQTDTDEAEKQYLLEYYSLVREGKTNYISTNAFHDVTNVHPLEPPDFFKLYRDEFLPKKALKKRKVDGE
ncbi:hypothetical protein VTN77DRAFT_9787 [Rasamsonia byssochlamydoides]|uniref:uncharacterized protein n=1 Tax=Rasamsonia byssochlamydoides TaxID=89139 RepID=UPI003744B1D4